MHKGEAPQNQPQPQPQNQNTSLLTLFLAFTKIGFFTLGGGLAMMGVMRHELVARRKWLNEDKFLNNMSLATSVPGAVAINLAYLIGRQYAGWKGSVVALAGVILPSFITILLIVRFFFSYFSHPVVSHFFAGAAAAVTALIAFSTFIYGRRVIFDPYSSLITLLFFLLLFFFNLHPLLVILFSSFLRYLLPPQKEKPGL